MASSQCPRLMSQRLKAHLWQRQPPRRSLLLSRHAPSTKRHASSTTSSAPTSSTTPKRGPLVLEKPDRFRPPSHGKRLPKNAPRNYDGPRPTFQEQQARKKRIYPRMMPEEGSFMYWFLTDRWIHTYISLGVLATLAAYTYVENFKRTTPYRDQLPRFTSLFTAPFNTIHQFLTVFRMETERTSAEAAELRAAKIEEVQKRAEYKRAHGLLNADGSDPSSWLPLGGSIIPRGEKKESAASGLTKAGEMGGTQGEIAAREMEADPKAAAVVAAQAGEADADVYTDFSGEKKKVKKWLGIWS